MGNLKSIFWPVKELGQADKNIDVNNKTFFGSIFGFVFDTVGLLNILLYIFPLYSIFKHPQENMAILIIPYLAMPISLVYILVCSSLKKQNYKILRLRKNINDFNGALLTLVVLIYLVAYFI